MEKLFILLQGENLQELTYSFFKEKRAKNAEAYELAMKFLSVGGTIILRARGHVPRTFLLNHSLDS